MKTIMAKKEDVQRKWFLVDAEGKTLGRIASGIAEVLIGKHKPIFTPHVDTGDHIIVINANKVQYTGKKLKNKIYYHHSRYPGGLKAEKLEELLKKKPEDVLKKAVKGMLPKSILGKGMIKKLKIYCGSEHPHTAQRPENLKI
ncbi:MAG: 50S ribosomal protein L13 [Nitrospirae bacterium]|nr:50S ribosomal protein L13 [Nitrospirota bacterium]